MEKASTGGLAGSLLGLANALPEQQRGYFLRPSLEQRVRREITSCCPGGYAIWCEGISLLGAAAALGLRIETIDLPRLGSTDLSAILDLRKLEQGHQGIGPLQIQLWLGLRELARLCGGLGAVPAQRSRGQL